MFHDTTPQCIGVTFSSDGDRSYHLSLCPCFCHFFSESLLDTLLDSHFFVSSLLTEDVNSQSMLTRCLFQGRRHHLTIAASFYTLSMLVGCLNISISTVKVHVSPVLFIDAAISTSLLHKSANKNVSSLTFQIFVHSLSAHF